MSDTYTVDPVATSDDDLTPETVVEPEYVPEDETPEAPVVPASPAKATPLEPDLKAALDDIVTGALVLAEGKSATPYVLAGIIGERRGNRPSTGAVADAMQRWASVGFITLAEKPMAFVDYTEAGRTEGLTALKRQSRSRRSAARKAERDAAKAEVEAAPVAPLDEPPF